MEISRIVPIKNRNKDIFFMRESNQSEDKVKTGFFIIKNNKNIQQIIQFFESVLREIETTPRDVMYEGDQTIINKNKHQLKYGFIPNEYVVFGTRIFDINRVLFHHAIGTFRLQEKLEQIEWVRSQIGN